MSVWGRGVFFNKWVFFVFRKKNEAEFDLVC